MRDLLIITLMCLAALTIGAWLYFYGPIASFAPSKPATVAVEQQASASTAAATPPVDVTFTVIAHGANASKQLVRKNFAIYSKDEYERIWKLTGSTEKMPTIDFTKAYVVAVFLGEKPTGGYSVSVEKITDSSDIRTVSVRTEKPGEGCVTTEALTSPYQFIRVLLSGATLASINSEKVVPCN